MSTALWYSVKLLKQKTSGYFVIKFSCVLHGKSIRTCTGRNVHVGREMSCVQYGARSGPSVVMYKRSSAKIVTCKTRPAFVPHYRDNSSYRLRKKELVLLGRFVMPSVCWAQKHDLFCIFLQFYILH